MKKEKLLRGILLWCLVMGLAACTNDDNAVVIPQDADLKEVLQETGLFYDITEDPDAKMKEQQDLLHFKAQYSMYFKQATNHDDANSETFMQRVCILFRGYDRPTVFVTEGYLWQHFGDTNDLAANLNANMVHVEHRNYGTSYNQDKGVWNYQTMSQSSADLHAVYQALKPIFKGKWMSGGTSKSGETSIGYAYYYPQDMDLAVAFCSPFATSLDDKRFAPYLMEEVGTEESRSLMKAVMRKTLENGENGVYKDVCEKMKKDGKEVPSFTKFVFNLFDDLFQIYQYEPDDKERIEQMELLLSDNDALLKELCKSIIDNDTDDLYCYWVECAKQQGLPNAGYDYFADLLEGTSFDKNEVLPSLLKKEDRGLEKTYDNTLYNDLVNNFFLTSACPLLLYYVHDDPWTAARPPKVGPNAKLIISPIGKHHSTLNNPALCPPAIRQEVMDYVQKYIY